MTHILNKTSNGIIFKCSCCKKIHIEFNNINLNFTEKEYNEFSCYIKGLDGEFWENVNKESIFKRKIRIPLRDTSICFMLSNEELKALQTLLAPPFFSVEQELVTQFKELQCLN